jgi:hypothetical protein
MLANTMGNGFKKSICGMCAQNIGFVLCSLFLYRYKRLSIGLGIGLFATLLGLGFSMFEPIEDYIRTCKKQRELHVFKSKLQDPAFGNQPLWRIEDFLERNKGFMTPEMCIALLSNIVEHSDQHTLDLVRKDFPFIGIHYQNSGALMLEAAFRGNSPHMMAYVLKDFKDTPNVSFHYNDKGQNIFHSYAAKVKSCTSISKLFLF